MQRTKKINLVFSRVTFTAANLSFDLQKRKEAIYYSPKDEVQTYVTYDVNAKIIAGRLDYFSFHTDGNVHAK